MIIIKGRTSFGGIALGNIFVYNREQEKVTEYQVIDIEGEIARFESAKQIAAEQLDALYEQAKDAVSEETAMIFQVHKMLLEDQEYIDSITQIIKTKCKNCEVAIQETMERFVMFFEHMEDDYMKARAADIKDISERLKKILLDSTIPVHNFKEPVIILADDLLPSEVMQLEKSQVLALVLCHGTTNSHAAILARTMNIPAIFGIDTEFCTQQEGMESYGMQYDKKSAIVNGNTGEFIIEPDAEKIQNAVTELNKEIKKTKSYQELKGKENITQDGQEVKVCANIGSAKELEIVFQNDADGVGLFRSEFIFMESKQEPTEEEQFKIYRKVAEGMKGKKVIIRTLDIGADKQVPYFQMEQEANSALGCRGIRVTLEKVELFKNQLRALYRASAYGKLSILFPMIVSVEEVYSIKKICEEVKRQLRAEQIPFDEQVRLGAMIETPAAVMVSEELAKEVDFFSIGTNDLTQYTLAMDRQNPKLASIYNTHHPAILRMIYITAKNAHKQGIPVGICGELAADLDLIPIFLSMGIDELSVSPDRILPIRQTVRELNISEIKNYILKNL